MELVTHLSKPRGIPDVRPASVARCERLGRTESQVANWGLCVRHAEEAINGIAEMSASYITLLGAHCRAGRGTGSPSG